jgi:hypothetical protein
MGKPFSLKIDMKTVEASIKKIEDAVADLKRTNPKIHTEGRHSRTTFEKVTGLEPDNGRQQETEAAIDGARRVLREAMR